ncbi:hypothetical protein XENTR_v10001712 [Xenopus tropicalis]|uniref:Uncharacterized protein LOC101733619 n=1 Tax=Xenopus tropicalis TaxID=8364 RepID=A0A8J0QXD5_XENTR|nr:uncharacterized protein LOC101733619 [Xenopus tropicalis]KAE8632907.1 hypothetical protein XENTR_v10001712 [Xenopus tropicalis]|eukprot:XP_004910859.1 PREDICTED: uncharacterized protein LOC101733619 [Xenopus tropicalis]
MKSFGIYYLITTVFLVNCETQENVSLQVPLSSSSSPSIPVPVTKESPELSQIDQMINIHEISTEPPEALPTRETGLSPELPSSYLSPLSDITQASQVPQHPQTDNSETSFGLEETNNLNEIFTEDDKLYIQGTIVPELKNVVKDFTSVPTLTLNEPRVTTFGHTNNGVILEATKSSSAHAGIDTKSRRLRLEPWKIGLISAAVFLAVEAVVLIVYCFVCKRRRRAILTKSCDQDSEACETINVESNDNTLTGVDGTINRLPAQHTGDSSQSTGYQEEQQRRTVQDGHVDYTSV